MTLSCSCDDWYPEPGDTFVNHIDYDVSFPIGRRKRCVSCGTLIGITATCHKLHRARIPEREIECRIYGEDAEIPAAPWYWCEECGDLHQSISDLGYCAPVTDNPKNLLKEYQTQQEEKRFMNNFVGPLRRSRWGWVYP